jgi:hypothetical protein
MQTVALRRLLITLVAGLALCYGEGNWLARLDATAMIKAPFKTTSDF